MAEESLANKDQPASDTKDAEYDRIFATLAETETGRRFLEEYARRVRPIEIEASLAAIERMQTVIRAGGASERLRLLNEIVEMAGAITRVRAEILAIKPPGGTLETTEVLDSIVRMTEEATSRILAATEQMQETAFALRTHDADARLCDRLDALATEIFTACTFQDLTGQRTRKVIDTLRDLEDRINIIIGSDGAAAEIAAQDKAELGQADVDAMLAPEFAGGRTAGSEPGGHQPVHAGARAADDPSTRATAASYAHPNHPPPPPPRRQKTCGRNCRLPMLSLPKRWRYARRPNGVSILPPQHRRSRWCRKLRRNGS